MTQPINIPAGLGLPPLPSSSPDTIAALMWIREVLQEHQKTLYAVQDPKGIDELKPVKIGGVDQWLQIRGRNRNNPVLLWLHGGPGGAIIGAGTDALMRPWEDYFTIVLWDQRQTGKSYYPADDENSPLTVQQFVDDTEEVMHYIRAFMQVEKMFVIGASWGTQLGMHMVKRHPEWIHAYVGVGQVVCTIEAERVLCERLLGHAKEHNEQALINKLDDLVKLLKSESPERETACMDNCLFVRKELSRLAGEAAARYLPYDDLMRAITLNRTISPDLTITDISNAIFGGPSAILRPDNTFPKSLLDGDLRKDLGNEFDAPIFFFTGRHDWQTPITLSDQWFSDITAPHKELIHFEESSHTVIGEEPGKFLIALVNKVLPFAKQ